MTKPGSTRPPVAKRKLPKSFKELTPSNHFSPRTFFRELVWKALLTRRTGEHKSPVFPKLNHGQVAITWIGHASFLIQFTDLNVLIDPNFANWLFQPDRHSLGASTVVMGCIGLLALTPRANTPTDLHPWRGIFGGIAGAAMLFMLHGLDPRTDVLAHAGGFITGLGLAVALRASSTVTRGKASPHVATLLFAILLLASWTGAMRAAN